MPVKIFFCQVNRTKMTQASGSVQTLDSHENGEILSDPPAPEATKRLSLSTKFLELSFNKQGTNGNLDFKRLEK